MQTDPVIVPPSQPDEPEPTKTQCQHHRDSVQTTSPEGYPIVGAYVPQCDDIGRYMPLQVCEKWRGWKLKENNFWWAFSEKLIKMAGFMVI